MQLIKEPMKALETEWNDFRFRSRLEARHAVVFDFIGLDVRYEHQGFDLDGDWYLPDFYAPKQKFWIEIKPIKPTPEEERKAWKLAKHTKEPVYILWGDCWLPIAQAKKSEDYDGGYLYTPDGDWENFQWLFKCPKCGHIGIELFGQSVLSQCGCPVRLRQDNDYDEKLVAAYKKARGMRFDGTDKEEDTKEKIAS